MFLSYFGLTSFAHAQELSASLVNDYSRLITGGVDEDASTNRALGVVAFEYKFDDTLSFHADALFQQGDNFSDSVGDLQGVSNIDTDNVSKLYELWVQKEFTSLNLRVKIGQVDANTEFGSVEHAGEFLNSSMGYSPTVSYMPSYPAPRPSLNLFWQAADNTEVSLGYYSTKNDNNEDSLSNGFTVAQWNQQFSEIKLGLGYWRQQGIAGSLNPEVDKQNASGYFATMSGDFMMPFMSSANSGWFFQFGYSDDLTSAIDLHIGTGVQWYGVNNRENDVFGLGVTHIETSPFLIDELHSAETTIEVFYRYQINDHFSLKPDLQFITQPAANLDAQDAVVFTLRIEMSI